MNLAARGTRNMDEGNEAIENPEELSQVKQQARKVHLESVVTAALLTALSLLIPEGG